MTAWFITGISRGLGKALAEASLRRGDTVIGTVRTGDPGIDPGGGTLHLLRLDIAEAGAAEAAVEEAFRLAGGRLDVVVNNAGYGLLGAIEAATDAEVERLFAIDVFGPFRVIRAALPHLRAQGGGHIINVTSIAGRAPSVGAGLYGAAKFALEGLSQSLAQEAAPLGIRVTAVAPGAFRTDFLSPHSVRHSDRAAGSAVYGASVGQRIEAFDAMAGRQIGDPARAAEAILAIVDSEDPPLHLLLGSDALARARRQIEAMQAEMERWSALTLSTDHPAGA